MRTITRENQIKFNYPEKIMKGSVEHRHFLLLNNLYEEKNINTMKPYFIKYKVGAFRTGVLVDLEYLKRIHGREYRWIGDPPTIKDSIILMETLREERRGWLKTHNRKKKEEKINKKLIEEKSNIKKEEKEYIFTEKKSKLKDIPEIKPAIKSKHISLFWGMFKFEINK